MTAATKPPLTWAMHADANRLISTDALALLIGLVLDQQQPIERAFTAPWDLQQRLGSPLRADYLSSADPDTLADVFRMVPALHRFPKAKAAQVQALCAHIVQMYAGDAAQVWTTAADGAELVQRARALPGFGDRTSRVLVAILGKRLGVEVPGWREAAGDLGVDGSLLSVADVESAESLQRYRAAKRAAAAPNQSSGARIAPTAM